MAHTPSALRNLPGVSLTGVRQGASLPSGMPELLEPLDGLDGSSWLSRIWRGQPWLVVGLFAVVFVTTTALVAMHRPAPAPVAAPELAAPAAGGGGAAAAAHGVDRDGRALGVGGSVDGDDRHRRRADAVEPVHRPLPEGGRHASHPRQRAGAHAEGAPGRASTTTS